jgi:hypothetical protein
MSTGRGEPTKWYVEVGMVRVGIGIGVRWWLYVKDEGGRGDGFMCLSSSSGLVGVNYQLVSEMSDDQ